MSVAHPPATARLAFRTWRDDDVDLAVALWSDPEVARYITAFNGPPTRASCLDRLGRELACQGEHGVQYWPVFAQGGDHVGCAGLRPYRPDNAASRAMLGKLGFRYAYDELYPPTGRIHPSYLLEGVTA